MPPLHLLFVRVYYEKNSLINIMT